MGSAFRARVDIKEIVGLLPDEEVAHMRRVGALVERLVQKRCCAGICRKCPDEYRYFGEAAAYHDIGKVWVPKSILTKPDRLTAGEKAIIRQHPLLAQKLFDLIDSGFVSGMPQCLVALAVGTTKYHHEWWDGTGYPYGIARDAIPLIARITSICDAYDAMTNNRVYIKTQTRTHYDACRELEEKAGTQFDPVLVRMFLDE